MKLLSEIYLNTVLLDNKRWTKDKIPEVSIREVSDKIKESGFNRLELWEYHYSNASLEEREYLESDECEIPIFNSYCGFTDDELFHRNEVIDMAQRVNAKAIKFNLGGDSEKRDEYMRNFSAWRTSCPQDIRLLCECHPGTVVENAAQAKQFFDQAGWEQTEVIVHPFNRFDSLQDWMDTFQEKVTHLHFQMRDLNDEQYFSTFSEREGVVRDALDILKSSGFAGTASVEFSKGTRTSADVAELLLQNACKDLSFLREYGY